MNKGILFIISAPSGTGKSTLIQSLIKKISKYKTKISISYTTRNKRIGETNGKHYYFVSKNKFKKMIKNKEFLEYAIIFENYYGTPKKIIKNLLSKGINIFLNIDWQGAKQIKKKIKNNISIYIIPPSINELVKRLKRRGSENKTDIKKRIKQSMKEIKYYIKYDHLIINDKFNIALSDLKSIFISEYKRIKNKKNIK
ncbi:guanylate kinase [Candidatus Purcelliella pentastirinorum]|uniref:Guanylate kinase n=1 Tax=Candidatus Purcelliella pentastirinorum TaxID=472834 RepID=A0AAX3N854_9ENTR|nr:guanylate kinase [Candidatus Purcelliella pentastirinorum]WDI78634.1 guanylate kinase [Candidatus Purcelliella pentastirinorum]WDR80338.1 guanylate kinase [Candidatus Purcelliella pentastirinorum]